MNFIEEEIIKLYIIKDKQERILWELSNHRKRESVIWKFSGPNLFKRDCLQPIEYMSQEKMEKYLSNRGGVEEVYFIGESIIGKLSLTQAVAKAHNGERCIIYCGNGFGYYQGEREDGTFPRFLLSAPSRDTGTVL